MAAHLPKPTRAAWIQRRRALLERKAAEDARFASVPPPAPTPLPVSVDIAPTVDFGEPERETRAISVEGAPRPRRARRLAAAALTLAAAGAAGVAIALNTLSPAVAPPQLLASLAAQVHLAATAPLAAPAPQSPAPTSAPLPPIARRADAHAQHKGYAHIPGGVLYLPDTFTSVDGSYDLYLHFHGNVAVVRESAEYAGLNAVVAVVNLGQNSAPYLDRYAVPTSYEELLASIDRAVLARGLETPHRRRVAIGSWSGGYGAVSRILEHGRGLESLDAVLVLDGIHCGFAEDNPKALNTRILMPFLDATRRAAEGKILFSITHSEIDPIAYAGTSLTAGYLLDVVHGKRGAPEATPPEHVQLKAAEGAVSKALEKWMEPISEARVGTFHVRGYRGNTPEHHMAHLLQMGATVLPELVARWQVAP